MRGYRAIFYVVVSVSSWSWNVQCVAEQAIEGSFFSLPDVDATAEDLSASGNLFDLNNEQSGSDSANLISSELLNSNGDMALNLGGNDGSSCAQPLGKRDDDLFANDNLLLSNS